MDKSFVLQYVHACRGYKNFFHVWCRVGNDPNKCPTEKEWEYFSNDIELMRKEEEYKHPPLSELVNIFPEIVPVARKKLLELKEVYMKMEESCNKRLDELLFEAQTTSPVIMNDLKNRAMAPLEALEDDMKKWERIVRMDEWKRKPPGDSTITDIDIARAKEFPLTSLVKVNQAGFIKCPFHNEKTPSCKIFKDNRFHCFGCQADGDVVDYVMKENNIDFIKAVKRILNK